MKLLFLARVWDEVARRPNEAAALQGLFGEPPFAEEVFDRFWTLERMPAADEDADEVLDSLSSKILDALLLAEGEPLFRAREWRREEEMLLAPALTALAVRLRESGAPQPFAFFERGGRPIPEAVRLALARLTTVGDEANTTATLVAFERTPEGLRAIFRCSRGGAAASREIVRFAREGGDWSVSD